MTIKCYTPQNIPKNKLYEEKLTDMLFNIIITLHCYYNPNSLNEV